MCIRDRVKTWFYQKPGAKDLLMNVKNSHQQIAAALLKDSSSVFNEINDLIVEIEWIIEESPQEKFDYYYDKIVSIGEMLSTKILAYYLTELGLPAVWVDARDIIQTDNTYRDARIDWENTQKKADHILKKFLEQQKMVITQGFIAVSYTHLDVYKRQVLKKCTPNP